MYCRVLYDYNFTIQMNIRKLLLMALVAPLLLASINGVSTAMTSSNTLVSGVTYTVNVTFTGDSINASSLIGVQLSQSYNINGTNLLNCQGKLSAGASLSTTSCSVSTIPAGYNITFPSLFSSASTVTFLQISFSINNPYLMGNQVLTLSLFDSSGATMSGTAILTYAASSLTSGSWSSSSNTVGTVSTMKLSFSSQFPILSTSLLVVELPLWSVTNSSNFNAAPVCSNSLNLSPGISCSTFLGGSTETLTLSTLFASNISSTTSFQASISNMFNPPSTQTYGPINLYLYNNSRISLVYSGITYSVSSPGALQSVTFGGLNKVISYTYNTIVLIRITNPLPASALLLVTYTPGPTVSYSGSTAPTYPNSSSMLFSSIVSSVTSAGGSPPKINKLVIVAPPSTASYSFTLTTLYNSGGVNYSIDTGTYSFNCDPGLINGTLSPASTLVNSINIYTLQFTTTNALTIGSFVTIIAPLGSPVSGSCSCNISSTCVVTSQNITITLSNSVAAATTISATFTITNLNSARTTGNFQVYSYYTNLASLVDQLTSGPTVTMTSKPITTASVTPTSTQVSTSTTYSFSITMADPIPIGGSFTLIFPSDVSWGTSPSLTILASSLEATCQAAFASSTVTFTQCFQLSQRSISTSISFSISPVINPMSFNPSGYFAVYTYDSAGNMINYLNSSLNTFRVTMDTAGGIAITTSLNNYTVNQGALYTFTLVFSVAHVTGDYLIVTFPPGMSSPGSPSCTPTSGLTAIPVCTANTASSVKMSMTFGSGFPSNHTVSFTISTINNYQIPGTVTFQIQSFNSNDNSMQSSSTMVSFVAAKITSVQVSNDNKIVLLSQSNISLTVTTPFALQAPFSSSNTQLIVTLPPDITAGTGPSCSSTVGTCTVANSSSYIVTNIGLAVSSVQITLTNVTLPFISASTASFSLLYQYNLATVAQTSSGVVISPYCTAPCMQCSTSPTTCVSCLPNTAQTNNVYIYLDPTTNNTCLQNCPAVGYFQSSGNCTPCNISCNTCTSATVCTACKTGFALSASVCLTQCPAAQYNNTMGICTACVLPCGNCINASQCLSCATGYLYNATCIDPCPAGYFPLSGNCTACNVTCTACTSATVCTGCKAGYALSAGQCVTSCPAAQYNNSIGVCTACVPPCGNCTNATFCLTCAVNNFYNNTCIDPCPVGYYPLSAVCTLCNVTCTACTSATSCTGCIVGYVLTLGQCLTSCPATQYNSSGICVPCVIPCGNCVNATFCLTCAVNNFYNNTCISPCPVGYYPLSAVCTVCNNTCTSCTSATVCTGCVVGFVLSAGQCLASCPATQYNNSGICTACLLPCGNCVNATYCLTCVINNWYNGSCLNPCPTGYYALLNNCTTCPTNCSACISATNCTSCNPGYVFVSDSCPTTCPAGYFSNGTNCTLCNPICATCSRSASNCTSCTSDKLFYNNMCYILCPDGTYESSSTCVVCPSACTLCTTATTCSVCATGYFFYQNFCYTTCPNTTVPNNGVCQPCTSPCRTCSILSTTCTSCSSGALYNNTCVASCPSGLTPSNGVCVSCGVCDVCINLTACAVCPPSYYMYNNTCSLTCPSKAPIAQPDFTCSACDQSCLTCQSVTTNCTSCISGKYLIQNKCLSTCPAGLVGDPVSGLCIIPSTDTKLIYFPVAISMLAFAVVIVVSKIISPQTQVFTSLSAIVPLFEFLCVGLLGFFLLSDTELSQKYILALILAGILGVSLMTNMFYFSFICRDLCSDPKYNEWQQTGSCKVSKSIVYVLSMISFKTFRLIYSRLFGQVYFSAKFTNKQYIMRVTTIMTTFGIICLSLTAAGVAAFTLYLKNVKDQTYLSALETIVVTTICALVLLIDTCWQPGSEWMDVDYSQEGMSGVNQPSGRKSQQTPLVRESSKRQRLRSRRNVTDYSSRKRQSRWTDQNYIGQDSQQEIKEEESERPISQRNQDQSVKNEIRRHSKQSQEDNQRLKTSKVGQFQQSKQLGQQVEEEPDQLSGMPNPVGSSIKGSQSGFKGDNDLGGSKQKFRRGRYSSQAVQTLVPTRDQEERRIQMQKQKELEALKKEQDAEREAQNQRQVLRQKQRDIQDKRVLQQQIQRQREQQLEAQQLEQARQQQQTQRQEQQDRQTEREAQAQKAIEIAKLKDAEEQKQRQRQSDMDRKLREEAEEQEALRLEQEKRLQQEHKLEQERRLEQEQRLELLQLSRREEESRARLQQLDRLQRLRVEKQRADLEESDKQKQKLRTNRYQTKKTEESLPLPKDQDAQDLTFEDRVIIDREVERKRQNEGVRTSLSASTSNALEAKKLKKQLQAIGIDPSVLETLFGKGNNLDVALMSKLFSPQLNIPKDVLKRVFNRGNDPQLMQELFGEGNNTDMDKVVGILKSGDNKLIDRLFTRDKLNTQLSRQVVQKKSSITSEFIRKTIGNKSIIPEKKLQTLFRKQNKPDMYKLSKVIGDKAELQVIMENMLGEDSEFDVTQLRPILTHLKPEIIRQIFNQQNQVNDTIIQEILNDKTINMKDLGDRILKHKQNMDNTKKVLDSGSDITVDNFKRLINQSKNLDQRLLDDFMTRPELIQKLFEVGLDPQFMGKMLQEGSKIDLDLFQKVIMKASPQTIQDLFQYFPGAVGLDFEGIRMLFEKGNNSDPDLISQLLEDPDLFANIYSKGNNDPHMLKKLVQKGSKFDKSMIDKVYSKKPTQFQHTIMGAKINSHNTQIKRKESADYASVQHNRNRDSSRQLNLNRTGTGFPNQHKRKPSENFTEGLSAINSRIRPRGESPAQYEAMQYEYQFQQSPAQQVVKRKVNKGPKTKRQVVDVRLPSEQIYLQRLQHPHDRRKKRVMKRQAKANKKGGLLMDEDNQVYDHDF